MVFSQKRIDFNPIGNAMCSFLRVYMWSLHVACVSHVFSYLISVWRTGMHRFWKYVQAGWTQWLELIWCKVWFFSQRSNRDSEIGLCLYIPSFLPSSVSLSLLIPFLYKSSHIRGKSGLKTETGFILAFYSLPRCCENKRPLLLTTEVKNLKTNIASDCRNQIYHKNKCFQVQGRHAGHWWE